MGDRVTLGWRESIAYNSRERFTRDKGESRAYDILTIAGELMIRGDTHIHTIRCHVQAGFMNVNLICQ